VAPDRTMVVTADPAPPEWAAFLAASPNATLFHELPFLAYHAADRFRFHHLVVRDGAAPAAVVPGGLVGGERPVFTSPVGASVGGPALAAGARASDVEAIVAALQEHATTHGWGGLEFTLPPAVYAPEVGDMLSFALFRRGFSLTERWLCPMLPIARAGDERHAQLFRARFPKFVRAARRSGVRVEEHGVEGLSAFLNVFDQTYQRHGVAPTHSAAEIEDLLGRFPERIRIFLAMLDRTPAAGLLVFLLNPRVAYTFYICANSDLPKAQGNLVAIAGLLDWLGERGYSWLDLGPGASLAKFNDGVMFFKENLGAIGHTRDRWRWSIDATHH